MEAIVNRMKYPGFGWLPLLSRFGKGDCGIHAESTFKGILRRERERADRNAHGFALVVFSFDTRARPNGAASALTRMLKENVRVTDEVGWLGKLEIGVFLPETGFHKARLFVERLRPAVSALDPAPGACIHIYPENEDGPGGGQLVFETILSQTRCPPVVMGALPDTAAVDAHRDDMGFEQFLGLRLPAWKRALDLCGALLALVLFAPLMIVTAALVKTVSRGPAIFSQARVGFAGKLFRCHKFRTMRWDNDASCHQDHLRSLIRSGTPMTKLDSSGDPRVIPLGGILRATALDELPQLFNVLKGEMSLIGPRPCIPYEYGEYSPWQRKRVDMLPGMTGLWQVSGKNRLTFSEMMRLDLRYARVSSLPVDLAIIGKTLPAIAAQIHDRIAARNGRRNRLKYA